jgi:uncharacterized membrane protein
MKFDRERFLTGGAVTLTLGIFGFVIVYGGDEIGDEIEGIPLYGDLIELLSPILALVSPVLAIIGIVMVVLALASGKDVESASGADDSQVESRAREIMESEGVNWKAAWRRARMEMSSRSEPSQEQKQGSYDLETKLAELKRLHDNGLLDTEEYQRKQRQLLDKL